MIPVTHGRPLRVQFILILYLIILSYTSPRMGLARFGLAHRFAGPSRLRAHHPAPYHPEERSLRRKLALSAFVEGISTERRHLAQPGRILPLRNTLWI